MIRIRTHLCNTQLINNPPDSLFCHSEYPDLSFQVCPACKARGFFASHGTYARYVIDLKRGKPITYQIKILRVKCECSHTHALLKDSLIPYCSYSLRFILQVMKAYFRRSCSVEKICELFCISVPTLYRLKELYLEHRHLFCGLIQSMEKDPLWFLYYIDHLPLLSDFLESFRLKYLFSFLQSHVNPAYS